MYSWVFFVRSLVASQTDKKESPFRCYPGSAAAMLEREATVLFLSLFVLTKAGV